MEIACPENAENQPIFKSTVFLSICSPNSWEDATNGAG